MINAVNPKLDTIIDYLRSSQIHSRKNELPDSFQNPDLRKHTEQLISCASTVVGANSTIKAGARFSSRSLPTPANLWTEQEQHALKTGYHSWPLLKMNLSRLVMIGTSVQCRKHLCDRPNLMQKRPSLLTQIAMSTTTLRRSDLIKQKDNFR